MRRRTHQISVEALFRRVPTPASIDQPWIDDENQFLEVDAPARLPVVRSTGGGRLASLRSEREVILTRYDYGAMPPGIYAVVRRLEIEISEIQSRA